MPQYDWHKWRIKNGQLPVGDCPVLPPPELPGDDDDDINQDDPKPEAVSVEND